MPKIILLGKVSEGKVIQINDVTVKIEYFQDDPKFPFTLYGARHLGNQSRVYILEVRKRHDGTLIQPPSENILLNFKKESVGARLYINSDIPIHWNLALPSHMISEILGDKITINVPGGTAKPQPTIAELYNARSTKRLKPITAAAAGAGAGAGAATTKTETLNTINADNFGGQTTAIANSHKRKNITSAYEATPALDISSASNRLIATKFSIAKPPTPKLSPKPSPLLIPPSPIGSPLTPTTPRQITMPPPASPQLVTFRNIFAPKSKLNSPVPMGRAASASTPKAAPPTAAAFQKKRTMFISYDELSTPKPKTVNLQLNIEQRKIGTEKLRLWVEQQEQLQKTASEVELHQLRAFRQFLTGRQNGIEDCVLEYATGAGKSFIFTMLPKITGEKFFIGVHRNLLEDQTIATIKKFCPNLTIGKLRECPDTSRLGLRQFFKKHDVIVGTYQKLRLNKSYQQLPFDIISTFVFDEAHNALTNKIVQLIEHGKSKGTSFIGATATPRIGKKDNGEPDNVYHLFGFNDPILKENSPLRRNNPITPFTIREAIDEGVCAPVISSLVLAKGAETIRFTHKSRTGKEKVSTDAKKISEKDAVRATDRENYNNIIVDLYVNGRDTYTIGEGAQSTTKQGKPFRGEQGMVYCSGIIHSIHMAEAFNKVSIEALDKNCRLRQQYEANLYQKKLNDAKKNHARKKLQTPALTFGEFSLTETELKNLKEAAHTEATTGPYKFCIAKAIHSKMSSQEVQDSINQFKLSGSLLLTGDSMLAEGFDHPPASLIFIASNTSSERALLQKAGRGGRKIRDSEQTAENGKIWRVFNMFWPTLTRNCKHFYMYLSENGAMEPKFIRGNDKIAANRAAYALKSSTASSSNAAVAAQKDDFEHITIAAGNTAHKPEYDLILEPTAQFKKLLEFKPSRAKKATPNTTNAAASASQAPHLYLSMPVTLTRSTTAPTPLTDTKQNTESQTLAENNLRYVLAKEMLFDSLEGFDNTDDNEADDKLSTEHSAIKNRLLDDFLLNDLGEILHTEGIVLTSNARDVELRKLALKMFELNKNLQDRDPSDSSSEENSDDAEEDDYTAPHPSSHFVVNEDDFVDIISTDETPPSQHHRPQPLTFAYSAQPSGAAAAQGLTPSLGQSKIQP